MPKIVKLCESPWGNHLIGLDDQGTVWRLSGSGTWRKLADSPEMPEKPEPVVYVRQCSDGNKFPCNPLCEQNGGCKLIP